MIYPENFEQKIGFTEIKTILKGRCLSSLGTEWIDKQLHFMTDAAEVNQALEQAREFKLFMEQTDEDTETEFFDVREPLLRVRPERTYLEEQDLFNLKRSVASVLSYVKFFTATDDDEEDVASSDEEQQSQPTYLYPALGAMAADVAVFPQIVARIDAILNKYGKVKDTASSELLSLRHQIEVTTRGISHSLRTIISEAQASGYIDRDVTPTLRDGRLVIPVAPALKRKIKGIVHDESATGKTVFIEPSAIVDANNKIRSLRAAERREVMRILQELTAEIRPHIPALLGSLQFLAHVDFLRAVMQYTNTFQAVVPQVIEEPQLHWVEARHPLLQKSLMRHGGKIVPLNISLRPHQRILLISGPNAGGKSVCLKTAALLQYMLQCGLPVPVDESSKPGIFSDIMIDIGDEQSIENDLSTYSSHLVNMKQMMQQATSRSLLLIDEFGTGTEPQIGGALAQAILRKFVKSQTFGIITTHYQNLKHFASHTPSIVNGAMLYDSAQLRPLFVLQIGNPGSSFAIEIARKIGIPTDVINYAAELVGKDYVLSDKYVQDIVRDKAYWEEKRQSIHQREAQLTNTISQYEKQLQQLQQERKEILSQAKDQAQQLFSEANARIENTIRTIKQAQAEKEKTKSVRTELEAFKEEVQQDNTREDALARKIAKIQRRQQRKAGGDNARARNQANEATAAAKLRAASGRSNENNVGTSVDSSQTIAPGSYVRIAGQSAIGRVESISGKKAKVLFGVIHTQVPLSQLKPSAAPVKNEDAPLGPAATFLSKETRDAMSEKRLHFNPQIDIRGMRVDEALTAVTYFIDEALQFQQSPVRILHGTGTGALRQLVRTYLKTVPGIHSFHDEHPQFGGAGITVVEL